MLRINKKSGFVLIEMIVTLSIIGVLVTSALIGFRSSQNQVALKEAQANIFNALEMARNKAASGIGTTDHGVHIEGNSIFSFEGSFYNPGDGWETSLPNSISVNPASTTVIFSRLTGQTDSDSLITIINLQGSTSTIEVTEDGIINLQE
jgi:prepilin-type N-terminal cleavage/methylation domain-containing protein